MDQEEKQPSYQIITKAIMYMPICDNNPIAATILDYLYSFSEFNERVYYHESFQGYVESTYDCFVNPDTYAEYGYSVDGGGNLQLTLKELREAILPMFLRPCKLTDQMIGTALQLLLQKGYIDLENEDLDQLDSDSVLLFDGSDQEFMNNINAELVSWYSDKVI